MEGGRYGGRKVGWSKNRRNQGVRGWKGEYGGGADGGLIRGRESKEEGGLRRGTLKSRVGQ